MEDTWNYEKSVECRMMSFYWKCLRALSAVMCYASQASRMSLLNNFNRNRFSHIFFSLERKRLGDKRRPLVKMGQRMPEPYPFRCIIIILLRKRFSNKFSKMFVWPQGEGNWPLIRLYGTRHKSNAYNNFMLTSNK